MYVFHNAPKHLLTPVIMQRGAEPILCAMVMDSEGRSHRIPPNTPWEVKSLDCMDVTEGGTRFVNHPQSVEKVAKMLCDNGVFYGIVPVPEIRDGISINFDLKSAERESTRVRIQAERGLIEKYVANAKMEQLQGRPIRPPSDTLQRILDTHDLDLLKDFGIQPVGYKVSEGAAMRDRKLADLEATNANQAKELAEMKEMLAMLLEDKEKEKKSRKPQPVQS